MEAGEQDADCLAVLDVGGRDELVDEQAVLVNQEMSLRPIDVLVRVIAASRRVALNP